MCWWWWMYRSAYVCTRWPENIEASEVLVSYDSDTLHQGHLSDEDAVSESASAPWSSRDIQQSILIPSVRPSVTRVDQSKTVKVRIMKFPPYDSSIHLFLRGNIHPKNLTDSPLARASNKSVVEKTSHFLTLGVNISKTVGLGDTFKVTIND